MSLTSQQYAYLADDAYKPYPPGPQPEGKEQNVVLGGITYKVLEHASNPFNGYQGTIYQRVDTGEIIVAHRGTEPDQGLGQILRDGALTDGAMATARINPQSADAIALTQRAIVRAKDIGRETGITPEVTVTGHSLGGTHAQITAHQFGLRGETFNAYGAASLSYRIPRGGDHVINHVMAGDFVSAASPHFGQVRVYASADEVATLHAAGYANDRNPLDPRTPGVAAGMLAGSHSMHHFLNTDGEGRPDRSLLAEPSARQLTQVFEPMVDKYRSDIALGRAAATVAFRGPAGTTRDLIDELRGPLSAGEPAARAEQAAAAQAELAQRRAEYHEQRQQFFRQPLPPIDPTAPPPDLLRPPQAPDSLESVRPYHLPEYPGTAPSPTAAPDADETVRVTAPRPMQEHQAAQTMPTSFTTPPQSGRNEANSTPAAQPQAQATSSPVPEHLRDFRHPDHPLHPSYQRFLTGVQQKLELPGLTPDQHERIAAGLTAAHGVRPYFAEVGRFHQDQDGALWASNLPPNLFEPPRWAKVDLTPTLAQTPEALAGQWREQHATASPAPLAHARAVDAQSLSPADLRSPSHPRHALFQQTSDQLEAAYAQWGLPQDRAQLERMAACCVVAARDERMSQVGGLQLSFPDGRLDRPAVTLRQHPAEDFGRRASVSADALAQAPELARSSLQLQAVEQQVTLLNQQDQQQRQEREMAQAQGRTM
ncbi:XVIPCD domain-containing protein [Pseudoxanthomonas wuyuanensis]